MNSDPEAALSKLLDWLVQNPNSTVSAPSGESSNRGISPNHVEAESLQSNNLDPLDSEEESLSPDPFNESEGFSFQGKQSLQPGEIPAVQDRFYTLLKRRLHAEIECKPPLFPWETELRDYEADGAALVTGGAGFAKPWVTQLQNLNLPVPIPEAVLATLLEQCQVAVQTSLKEGAKLVRAVENLFPGQSQALNQLAGLVLASEIPLRNGISAAPQVAQRLNEANFPGNYEVATPAQQMLLSLLAAREIMGSLSLSVSPSQTKVQRQWMTAVGPMPLEAEYQPQQARLRVQGQLPCGGSLQFQGDQFQVTAQRVNAGYLSVELFDLQLNQTYLLEVRLHELNSPPLIFAVRPVAK